MGPFMPRFRRQPGRNFISGQIDTTKIISAEDYSIEVIT